MSCATTQLLAAYVDDSHDAEGVMALIRDKYPKSMSTYLTHIRKDWMTLNKYPSSYSTDFAALKQQVENWKSKSSGTELSSLTNALQKLSEFHESDMQTKYNILRSLRVRNYTGHTPTDDLLSKLKILPDYIEKLKFNETERSLMQKTSSEALHKKSSESFTIEASKLLRRVHLTLQNKKSNVFDIACALSVVTGRRMVEIFHTGTFTAIAGNEYECMFDGQAKKQSLDSSSAYKIPLLAPLPMILNALNILRISKNTENLNNAEVNLKYSSSCNAAARRLLGEHRKFHDLRGIYGVISFHCAMPHTYSINMWLCKILGHSSLSNSLNYSSIHVTALDDCDKRAFSF